MIRNLFTAATFGCLLALQGCGSDADPSGSLAAQTHGKSEAEHGEGKIVLTPEQIQRADIRIAQAGPADLREHLSLYGVIAPNAERVQDVAARFPGMIQRVNRRVGDSVRRGETLATVESNESLQTYAVVSPMDGVVTMRNANEGAQAGEGALFTVADLSTVWVELSIFPRDVAKVRIGQAVRVRSVDTGLESEGKVVYVAPFGSSSNQTLAARVQLPNPDGKWPPGLYVNADVVLSSMRVPLAVQNSAIQTLDERAVVFVRTESGFELRNVKLGRSDGETSEVINGVAAGDSYATHNSFILKAELGKGEAGHED